MNFVLVHLDGPPPEYAKICQNQIRKYFSGPIYFHGDGSDRFLEAEAERGPHVKEFDEVSQLDKCGKFWNVTFRRLFILEEIIRLKGLTDVIHVENDVTIYESPGNIPWLQRLRGQTDKVHATVIGQKYASYAYVYIPDFNAIRKLNEANMELLRLGNEALIKRYGEGAVNEMLIARELMANGTLMSLPVMPEENSDGIFDSASWGQNLLGTPDDGPGWAEKRHYAGEAILAGRYTTGWRDGLKGKYPVIKNKQTGEETKLYSLHVHSKKLSEAI